MGENSKIEWTDHTFNPWIGCMKASEAKWREPIKWNADAEKRRVRARVFCASMADVFEDHPGVEDARARLFGLIERTPNLDWQLLTKRPENVLTMVPYDWKEWGFPPNVWIGTSVEDEQRADERIPILALIPARVRFLSCEPLLGPVSLRWLATFAESAPHTAMKPGGSTDHLDGLRRAVHWVIVGGESGDGARPFDLAWARTLVEQCREAGVAVFVKQLGAKPMLALTEADTPFILAHSHTIRDQRAAVRLSDAKGGDWSEWPVDLRIREMPTVPADALEASKSATEDV